MPAVSERLGVNRPSLATCREFFAFAAVFVVVGCIVILWHGWEWTPLDWISAILAAGGLVYSMRLKEPGRMSDELAAKRDETLSQVAVFVSFFAFYSITAGSDGSPFNAHD